MKLKNSYKKIVFFLFFCVMTIAPAKLTKADTIVLRAGRMYTDYDVTGDRKADKFSVSAGNSVGYGYYKSVVLRVNGRKQVLNADRWTEFEWIDARLYRLKNKKTLLYIGAHGDNDHIYINGIYEYKGGSWKRILNLNNCFGKYRQYERGEVIACSGNSLKIRHEVMTWSLGLCRVDYTYNYTNGRMKRTSTYGKLIRQSIRGGSKYLNVSRNITVYKYCESGKKLLTLRKGAKIKVEKWRVVNGKFYYQINYKGKRGWIRGLTKKIPQYSNVVYF